MLMEELWQEDPYEYIRMKFGEDILHFLETKYVSSCCLYDKP